LKFAFYESRKASERTDSLSKHGDENAIAKGDYSGPLRVRAKLMEFCDDVLVSFCSAQLFDVRVRWIRSTYERIDSSQTLHVHTAQNATIRSNDVRI